jgi:hypothetical protein
LTSTVNLGRPFANPHADLSVISSVRACLTVLFPVDFSGAVFQHLVATCKVNSDTGVPAYNESPTLRILSKIQNLLEV